jgi:protein-tyrosine phosphatase
MEGFVDVHCHLMPYVDDGAENLDVAKEMLREQTRQGVDTIVLTPHWRSHMFTTPEEKIQSQFARLEELVCQEPDLPKLYLGREYHYSGDLLRYMEQRPDKIWTLGEGRFVLLEFSYGEESDRILEGIQTVQAKGYQVAVAHIERYQAVQQQKDLARQMAETGAWLQLNAESVMGHSGLRCKWLCGRLLKEELVHLIASDAHDLEQRRPNLGDCARYLERKIGAGATRRLLCENPRELLEATN